MKILPVTLFRCSESAIWTIKTLTGTCLRGPETQYHTGSRLGHIKLRGFFLQSNNGWTLEKNRPDFHKSNQNHYVDFSLRPGIQKV
jgi:hypothetical protein